MALVTDIFKGTSDEALIKNLPADYGKLRFLASKGRAYHLCSPYPSFGFREWKEDERGPLPRCLPLCRSIVRRNAKWLFGKPISFKVDNGSNAIIDEINALWRDNYMSTKMVTWAEKAGYEGGFVLFIDPITGRVTFYSAVFHSKVYFDDDDLDNISMLRLQYPVYNNETAQYEIKRTDYTKESICEYEPMPAMVQDVAVGIQEAYIFMDKLDESTNWKVKDLKPNPWNLIPAVYIRNIETGWYYGEGEMWNVFHLVDQHNLTFNLMHVDNQLSVRPNIWYIDLKTENDQEPRGAAPEEVEVLQSRNKDTQGNIKVFEKEGLFRAPMRDFLQDLRRDILDAVGSVEVNEEKIVNKGNLTQAVMQQVYAPLIWTIEEKRKTFGEAGICKLFELYVKIIHGKDVKISIHWPDYFLITQEELGAAIDNEDKKIRFGFTTQEDAVRSIATLQNKSNTDEITNELKTFTRKPEPMDQGQKVKR